MTPTNLSIGRRSIGGTSSDPHRELGTDERHERLANHFESMPQQFEAAKLGMWLFLATEVLLFGGLFCAYAVFRGLHPELFAWGSQFLDVRFGAANTFVLIFSSLTMALAVTWTQENRRWPVIIALSITFLCGVIFMAVKSVEYEHKFHNNLVWGLTFYETPSDFVGSGAGSEVALTPGDSAIGIPLWKTTCRSCHGVAGEGVTGQGRDIRSSEFIQTRTDLQLVTYINEGRLITDPLNTTGLPMPPKGGNPMFKDQDFMHIIAYIRSWQVPIEMNDEGTPDGNSEVTDGTTPGTLAAGEEAVPDASEPDTPETTSPIAASDPSASGEFWIPFSSVPSAAAGPVGLSMISLVALESVMPPVDKEPSEIVHHSIDPDRPANAHLFFSFYFLLTGLHAFHVLVGMSVIGWLIFRTVWGHFGRSYFTPIDLGGLYWHIVDLIWIFLFPLFYLIG